MWEVVEDSADIRLEDPVQRPGHHRRVQRVERIVRAFARTKALRPLHEGRLINRLQEAIDSGLQETMLDFGNAERSAFFRLSRFRNIYASNGR